MDKSTRIQIKNQIAASIAPNKLDGFGAVLQDPNLGFGFALTILNFECYDLLLGSCDARLQV